MLYRSCLVAFAILLVFNVARAQSPVHAWSHGFGDTQEERGRAVATDAWGNVIVTGSFKGTVDFGGGVLTSAGGDDIFVAKFDANGNHLWSDSFGDGHNENAWAVATDASGNVVIAGYFRDTVDFGGGTLTSGGYEDIFVAEFDANGNHIWSSAFGDSASQSCLDVTTDASGNVIITGFSYGTVDFGGGAIVNAGSSDIYVAKFDANGNHVWSNGFGDTSFTEGYGVATDASGNIIVTGDFQNTVDFGGGPITTPERDGFVVKFDANGNHIWSYGFQGLGDSGGYDVATDAWGNVFVTGYFQGEIGFGGAPIRGETYYFYGFVVKFDANGNHLWSDGFGDGSFLWGQGIATDSWGNVSITGWFNGTADFGGGLLTSLNTDMFVAKFDANGNHVWSENYGDEGYQYGNGVATDPAGNVILAGTFEDTVDFGGGPITMAGYLDIYVAKFSYAPGVSAIADVGNDQGRWVRINVAPSSRDAIGSPTPIVQYEAFRRVDPLPASGVVGSAAKEPISAMLSARSALLAGWEFVGAIPAHGELEYNMVVPTLADSNVAHGMHWSVFFVRAATADPVVFFDSAPDSGYSLDNLAPSVPASFAVSYNTGSGNSLSWDECPDADFDYFRVYRSTDPNFVPAPENQVKVTTGTSWSDPDYDGWNVYYKVSAVDFSGNEGEAASEGTATGVGGTLASRLNLYPAAPNPFNPTTTIAYSIPEPGLVALHIYDVRGRRVRTLVSEQKTKGEHRAIWDGRDANGLEVASGVYFVRLEFGDKVQSRKIALMK